MSAGEFGANRCSGKCCCLVQCGWCVWWRWFLCNVECIGRIVDTGMEAAVPVIDLESADVVHALRSACESVGFFVLTNHGIGADVIERVFAAARQFFALDREVKQAIQDPETQRGYQALGAEALDPTGQTEGDVKEGFYVR